MGSKINGPGLYEFLIEAELQQYYNTLKNELKVQNVAQIKYVTDEDLLQIGMSRPEMRRLKKYFQKHYPSNVLAKMKKKLLSRGDNPISIASLSSNGPSSISKYSRTVAPGRHIIQADSIVIHKTLGSGEFGTVQQGVWTDHDGQRIQVAIKCLSQERMENNPVEFLKEAAIMHAVDHEHIVRLYGVVLDTAALMLVTELAPLRSLLECLKEPSMRQNLPISTLFDFAVQICAGMEYLESKRLIHRDLAARNILVFSRNQVKISDFGLSRALGVGKDYYQTNFNVNLKLPIAWCAPECINFLRFTSASDVWALGVTLWEMFSYGFQPWAALTGQQILEAIDEPNYQRLEKPECCPHEIYYQIMLKCWQHDANMRPSFAQLSNLLPECKPEQVQAIRESENRVRREFLEYEVGDIITVLEKKPAQGSEDAIGLVWKGVLKDGRSGLFNPANTITYLGSSFPTVKKSPFTRNDSRSSSMRKGRLSADMISGPQGDLKHTGHVGPDGQFFGDITFLGSKSWVPRQVVSPYKPELSSSETSSSDFATPIARLQSPICSTSKTLQEMSDIASSDTAPLLSTAAQMHSDENDHEYHEISDEENEMRIRNRGELGVSNPALSSKSQSPLESPRFDKSFDLEGPSLIDEVFGALQQERPDEAHNVKNELREMARSKKQFATVKPISSSDRKTLDHAIHLANELASRSMLDLDRRGKLSGTNNSLDDISSPRTPNSPSHKRKFSFILGGGRHERERRNYSQEAASIPDIQSTLTEEAKEAYNSLVEKPSLGSLGFLTPSFENKSMSFHFPEKSSCSSKQSEFFELEPSQKAGACGDSYSHSQQSHTHSQSISGVGAAVAGPSVGGIVRKSKPRNLSLPDERMVMNYEESTENDDEVDGNPLRLLRQNKAAAGATNVLPLPPRDRNKPVGVNGVPSIARHQRKHPLLIPSKISIGNSYSDTPPPPPPKPLRQGIRIHTESNVTTEATTDEVNQNSSSQEKVVENNLKPEEAKVENPTTPVYTIVLGQDAQGDKTKPEESVNKFREPIPTPSSSAYESPIVSSSKSTSSGGTQERIRLYENFESVENEISPENKVEEKASEIKETTGANKDEETQKTPPTPAIRTIHQRIKSLDLSISSSCSSRSSNSSSGGSNSVEESSGNGRFTKPQVVKQSEDVDPVKVKTVRRILGASATEEECQWAVEATQDSAHAVKLLRLKSLLPESLLMDDIERVISVLEMSHWDVARAAAFLLDSSKAKPKGVVKVKCRSEMTSRRSEYSSLVFNSNESFNSTDASNNNSIATPDSSISSRNSVSSSTSTVNSNGDDRGKEYIRPTRV